MTLARSTMPRSGAEVARAELIGGTDLGSGLGRQMERGRGGRHEAWGHAARGTTGVQPEARARVRGVRREMQGARRKALMKVRGVRREMWCT